MAGEVVELAARRPAIEGVAEAQNALEVLKSLILAAPDEAVAYLWLMDACAGFLRKIEVSPSDLAALAAGEVAFEVLARRYAGQMADFFERERDAGSFDGPGAA